MTRADLALCQSLNLIVDCNIRLMCFKDARGRVWNPNGPDEILAIEDVPNHPPHSRSDPGSSSQGRGNFPNLHNLYNIMQEILQVSKNAYSLGQSSSSRIRSMERNLVTMQNDITFIRDHIVFRGEEEEEEEKEGEYKDSDYAMVVVGSIGIFQVIFP
ncbi:hypothetical protein Hanom_Chr10g00923271 [Helianthus anomalus]